MKDALSCDFKEKDASHYIVSLASSQQSQMFLSLPEYLMHMFTCSHFKIQTEHRHLTINVAMYLVPSQLPLPLKMNQ